MRATNPGMPRSLGQLMPPPPIRIGTAGWSIPRQHAASFPADGSHLARYAQRLNAVEINSCFYRPHRRSTYERWAASVPDGFAFAAKLPKQITHELRLANTEAALDVFLSEASGLGAKLGPLLVQLPPSLTFDASAARAFLAALRARFPGSVVCEPRHATWFTAQVDALLTEFHVARVAADPPIGTARFEPGGWPGLQYFRLHGSPRVYYSDYDAAQIQRLAQQLSSRDDDAPCWCIFDNTALGAATANALALQAHGEHGPSR
jgi:uncharacterized protein YecE (DUF72 family)